MPRPTIAQLREEFEHHYRDWDLRKRDNETYLNMCVSECWMTWMDARTYRKPRTRKAKEEGCPSDSNS